MVRSDIVEVAFKLIEENKAQIKRMLASKNPMLVDEMWSDVVIRRAPNIANTWDPTKGASLKGHMLTNLNWYAFKYLNAHSAYLAKTKSLTYAVDTLDSSYYLPDSDTVEVVNSLLNQLSKQHAAILILRHYQGKNFTEIGESIGTERGAAMYHYNKALREAKFILLQQGFESVDDCCG